MVKIPVLTPVDINNKINGDKLADKTTASRHIWTDWKFFTEEQRDEIRPLGDKIFKLLNEDLESRNTWHYLLALGSMDYSPAQELMLDLLLNSPSENIRGFAADALSRYTRSDLSDNILKQLWSLIENDESLVVRINSLRAVSVSHFGTKNDKLAITIFALLKKQEHSALRTAILQILGDIGSTAVVPDLVHIMIARRQEMDKKGTALALDRIAVLNDYNDRVDLIRRITGDDIKEE